MKHSMIVYGNNGIGKTFFVSHPDTAPRTLMINTDGNTHVFKKNGGTVINLFTQEKNMWDSFQAALGEIAKNIDDYKSKYDTIVIDVIDHLYIEESNMRLKESGFETEMETYAGGFGSAGSKVVPAIRKEYIDFFEKNIEGGLKKHFNIVYISYEGMVEETRDGEVYSNIHRPAYLDLINSNSQPNKNRLLKDKVVLMGRITTKKVKTENGKIESRRVMILDQTDEFNDTFNRLGLESPMVDPTLGKILKAMEE